MCRSRNKIDIRILRGARFPISPHYCFSGVFSSPHFLPRIVDRELPKNVKIPPENRCLISCQKLSRHIITSGLIFLGKRWKSIFGGRFSKFFDVFSFLEICEKSLNFGDLSDINSRVRNAFESLVSETSFRVSKSR